MKYRHIVGGLLISVNITACGGQQTLTVASPRRTYEVRLAGTFEAPKLPLQMHVLSFEAFKDTARFAAGALYSADWRGEGFRDRYPSHEWPSESVLRFMSRDRLEYPGSATLKIVNSSGQPIPALTVLCGDLLLFVDQPTNSSNEVSVPTSPHLSVSIRSRRGDGTHFETSGNYAVASNRRKIVVTAEVLPASIKLSFNETR